eukprot:SM000089S23862  [mRNA]  locus=s89:398162:398675:+ [translate_table: standard]
MPSSATPPPRACWFGEAESFCASEGAGMSAVPRRAWPLRSWLATCRRPWQTRRS